MVLDCPSGKYILAVAPLWGADSCVGSDSTDMASLWDAATTSGFQLLFEWLRDYGFNEDQVKELGSHDMFIAEVVAINAEDTLIDKGTGAFQLNHARPLAYSHGKYYGLGEKIGGFGFSVKKKK